MNSLTKFSQLKILLIWLKINSDFGEIESTYFAIPAKSNCLA